jgi:hypothetical protein
MKVMLDLNHELAQQLLNEHCRNNAVPMPTSGSKQREFIRLAILNRLPA